MNNLLRYKLNHQETQLGVAYFAPQPPENMTLQECLAYLRTHPLDEFMRSYLRQILAQEGTETLRSLWTEKDPSMVSLILETTLLTPSLAALHAELLASLKLDAQTLIKDTPQVFLPSIFLDNHAQHAQLSQKIRKNIFEHQPLGTIDSDIFPAPPTLIPNQVEKIKASLTLPPPKPRRPAQETYALAMEKLYGLGIVNGPEMRHQASLSPWGLLRHWRLGRQIQCGSFAYGLEGVLTAYGRGLDLNGARASLAMEMIERYSSFATIQNMTITNNSGPAQIIHSSFSQLNKPALDPQELRLEVPYKDQALHWMEALDTKERAVLVPVQCVYLFCNLDEIQLFGALGSTGLGAGNTAEEAKVSGLTEIIERDCELTGLFNEKHCFRLTSNDPQLAELFQAHQAQGIDVLFQDLTSDIGVPCYKAFVHTKEGKLIKATGAGLSGQRAALSALTETPFPFPHGPASAPGPQNLPVRLWEELPDYSTGSATGDLLLLETLLEEQGYTPLYANLTKKEVGLPVYRCLVPGLEIATDFDQFSRISPRIWSAVLQILE